MADDAVPPRASTPLRNGDVNGAVDAQTAAVDAQTQNIKQTELAKVDALSAHAEAKALVYEGHSTAQGLLDKQYQDARQKARDDANADTAAWMRDMDQKVAEEPVPGRWWSNQTKFGQVMYLLSLSFGAMAQAKNPNLKNIALEMITKETEEDMAEQRDRIKRQIEGLKLRGQNIDKRLQAQLTDAGDDHGMLVSRLSMVQQAALERANAPGTADQKAAMAEAAQWAGQQRLVIAGERANRAYAEREGALNRDAENGRAMLTDKRDRDIAAATIQKDYDLARLAAGVKLSAKDDPRMKDSVVINPYTTGIRVVDATTGEPVATPLSANGGLTVAKPVEKETRQLAGLAQNDYATMNRVSKELAKGETWAVLLKRNPQLISDLVSLGYGAARKDLDPNGRVTDKDFVAGLENATGGDLETLSGRVAASTFSASQEKMKALIDKKIRDYPAFVSNRLGSLIDAAVPGYEGNIRVDWTPRQVEIDEASTPSTQQTDATYGIKTPIQAPKTVGDLENAQALEKTGVQALPPYKPGSHDKVVKALEDFKGAMPDTISARAGAVEKQLNESGDERAALEVQQAQYKAVSQANTRLDEVASVLRTWADLPKTGSSVSRQYLERGEEHALGHAHTAPPKSGEIRTVDPAGVAELARYHGLTQLTGQDVLNIIERAGLKPGTRE